ncbi:hypothetical protein FRC08_009273 [Ceratobasidium sp. 394]|nr:hypothetical protein FRC08_009273 [Ceratobasidium sp. 394]
MLTVSPHEVQPSDNAVQDPPSEKAPEPATRPFVQYTRAELLHLSKSPLVKIPDGMPPFKEWFGEWGDSGAAARKEPTSDSLSQLARDRRQVYSVASTSWQLDFLIYAHPDFDEMPRMETEHANYFHQVVLHLRMPFRFLKPPAQLWEAWGASVTHLHV